MHNREFYFVRKYDEDLAKPPVESFGQILHEAFLQPFNWKGRTPRKSYWLSALVNVLVFFISIAIFGTILASNVNAFFKVIDLLLLLAIYVWLYLAGLGQMVRRLHDVDYSGYWYWITFIPVGSFFLLYLAIQPSVQRPTKWGTYLYTDQEAYTPAQKAKVPQPAVPQILKEHFFSCFKWNARSTRTSYWTASFVDSVLCIVLGYCFLFLAKIFTALPELLEVPLFVSYIVLVLLIMIVAVMVWVFLAALGHTVRRLHDAGFNGSWFWIIFVPYVGYIILWALLFHPTTQNEVKWNGYLFDDQD